jgi:hypothetical protein
MSDKPLAVLLTAAIAAPLCLLCALGPAALAAAGGGLFAWLGGFAPPLIASLVAVAGWNAWRGYQRRSNAGVGTKHLPEDTLAEPIDQYRKEPACPDLST